MQLITGRFPAAGLTYPTFHDNPPFQTFEEVQRRIAAGGLKPVQIAELWDALYLTLPETKEILAHVHGAAAQPWLHPMLCFAAYTGARRAEMLRALVSDVDLDAQTVLIREKKRAKGRTTTRRIPLTPTLSQTLHEWIHDGKHPGGQHLFSQRVHVIRSKTKRTAPTPITEDEAHNHFKRVLRDTKWNVIRGYHVFRHSFISLCASRGIDQRLIDEWTGHCTEEQRRRYRHLFPTTQRAAIASVFGQ